MRQRVSHRYRVVVFGIARGEDERHQYTCPIVRGRFIISALQQDRVYLFCHEKSSLLYSCTMKNVCVKTMNSPHNVRTFRAQL